MIAHLLHPKLEPLKLSKFMTGSTSPGIDENLPDSGPKPWPHHLAAKIDLIERVPKITLPPLIFRRHILLMNSPPDPFRQPSILLQILNEAKMHQARGEKFLAVFDLDSTLFDLTLRISTIVDDFTNMDSVRIEFPVECSMAIDVRILPTDWGLQESLDRVGLSREKYPAFCQALQEHWAARFFAGDHLKHDVPLPGALRFVLTLRGFGADIMYLTGRDIPRMGSGTEASLKQHGFPIHEFNSRLVLKPDAHLDDAQFKVDVLKLEAKTYSRIWLFENEPVNLNLMATQLPEVGLVFLDTTHSRREVVNDALAKIPHFEVDVADFLSLG